MNEAILMIGNGKSTKELEEYGFHNIPDSVDTFGTGLAFRHWERIGWWPTYYAQCDAKVVNHHRDTYVRLINDPNVGIQKFFLSNKHSFLKKNIDLPKHPKLEIVSHSGTGIKACSKALAMGYKKILIIGMDNVYVWDRSRVRKLNSNSKDNRYKIIKDVKIDPNYYFDDYYQIGDVFSFNMDAKNNVKTYGKIDSWERFGKKAKNKNVEVIQCAKDTNVTFFTMSSIKEELDKLK